MKKVTTIVAIGFSLSIALRVDGIDDTNRITI